MHESVLLLLLDVDALKNPDTHVSQSVWVVVVPTIFVYLPGGHLMWEVMQESVLLLLIDAKALKNPFGHTSHSGWVVTEPIAFVYLPGGHFGWAMHRPIDNNAG